MPIPMIPPAIVSQASLIAAGAMVEASSALPPPYEGQVATRCIIPNMSNTSNKGMGTFSLHFAPVEGLKAPKFTFPNYIANSDGTVTGLGSDATIKASIQYPAFTGAREQIKFSGSASGTILNGLELTSDGDTLINQVPPGMPFLVWVNWYNPSGVVFTAYNTAATVAIDGLEVSTSAVTDKTLSGSIATHYTYCYGPIAITQMTRRPSAFLFGDSRYFGIAAGANDFRGDTGDMAKAIGPHCGYINFGVPSVRAYALIGNTTGQARRIAMAAKCSHIFIGLGINDIAFGGRTAANVRDDITTLAGLFPGKPVIVTTIGPYTTATSESYATTGASQTKGPNESIRTAYNDMVRAGISGTHGYWNLDDAYSPNRNSGDWRVSQNRSASSGTAQWGTVDGIHGTPALMDAIAASGVHRLSILQR